MAGVGAVETEDQPDVARLSVRTVVALAGGALVARLFYLFALTDVEATPSDASHYHELATNLAGGKGFVMHLDRKSVV